MLFERSRVIAFCVDKVSVRNNRWGDYSGSWFLRGSVHHGVEGMGDEGSSWQQEVPYIMNDQEAEGTIKTRANSQMNGNT